MKRWITSLVVCAALANVGVAQEKSIQIELSTGKHAFAGPLCIPLSVPEAWSKVDEIDVTVTTDKGEVVAAVGQLTAPSLTTESVKPAAGGGVRRDLHVSLGNMPTGKKWMLSAKFSERKPEVVRFAWTKSPEKKSTYEELVLTRSGTLTPVLRYMNRPYDASTKDARDKSYKVFHHLYDPTGKRFVTNGGHTNETPGKLLYPHHRGIMYGFNKCTYGPDLKKKADTWHCTDDAHVAHEKTIRAEAGPLLGRHRVLLSWHGKNNEIFASEERELTVYNVNGGTLVEFASRLKSTGGKVRLDGDPQHAGFQFRASNDVAEKTAKQTYYLRPDGKGDLGATRNWEPKTKKGPVDLPWYAVSFVLDKNRYSVCYMNHPRNPSETRFSERDYGRFGGYFEAEVTETQPLLVNYRLWMQAGEMTAEQAADLRAAFAAPPTSVVK